MFKINFANYYFVKDYFSNILDCNYGFIVFSIVVCHTFADKYADVSNRLFLINKNKRMKANRYCTDNLLERV